MSRWTKSGLALAGLAALLSACAGPRAFTRGEYGDPEEISMLDDRWNQNDMQLVAKTGGQLAGGVGKDRGNGGETAHHSRTAEEPHQRAH